MKKQSLTPNQFLRKSVISVEKTLRVDALVRRRLDEDRNRLFSDRPAPHSQLTCVIGSVPCNYL